MGLCRYCGRTADEADYPPEFREAFRPNLCFHCYEENPERADPGYVEEPQVDAGTVPEEPLEVVGELPDEGEDVDVPEDQEDFDPTDGEEDPDDR